MKRLVLHALLVLLCAAASPGIGYGNETVEQHGDWLLTKTVDPIDDKVSSSVAVFSEDKDREGVLMVLCNSEEFSILIMWRGGRPIVDYYNKVTVIHRFDKGKPESMEWRGRRRAPRLTYLSQEKPFIPLRADIGWFVAELKKHNKLAMKTKGTTAIIFSLKGSAYAIEMVEYNCGLRKQKPEKRALEKKNKIELF